MKNVMILVSGMAGTGKTSFAKWLSTELCAPLVCYDHILTKALSLAKETFDNEEQWNQLWRYPLGFF